MHDKVTCDIETFGLNPFNCGIATMAFATDKHSGFAFAVDYSREDSSQIRNAIKTFLKLYKGKIIYHNAGFDAKVLVCQLWMDNPLDFKGMYEGLDVIKGRFEDTMAIAVVATNNATENVLGLKPLAHPYAGNYGVADIDDVSKIPLDKLLQYNLVDALSTWYVYDTYHPIMIADQQEDFYRNMLLPTTQLS